MIIKKNMRYFLLSIAILWIDFYIGVGMDKEAWYAVPFLFTGGFAFFVPLVKACKLSVEVEDEG